MISQGLLIFPIPSHRREGEAGPRHRHAGTPPAREGRGWRNKHWTEDQGEDVIRKVKMEERRQLRKGGEAMEDHYQLFPLLLGHVPLFLLPATHAAASAPPCPLARPHYLSLLPDLPLGLSLATWKQSNTKLPSPNTSFLPFHMLASHKTILVHIYGQKYHRSRKSIPSGQSFKLWWAVLLTKVEWLSNLQSLTRHAKCHFFFTLPDFLAENVYPKKCIFLTTPNLVQCSANDKIHQNNVKIITISLKYTNILTEIAESCISFYILPPKTRQNMDHEWNLWQNTVYLI